MRIYIFLSLPLKSQIIHKYFCLKINCFNLGISEIFLWIFFTSPSSMLIFFIIIIIFITPNAQLKFPFLEELPYLAGTSKDVWCWAVSLVRCKTFDLINLHDQEMTLCCMHPNPITHMINKSECEMPWRLYDLRAQHAVCRSIFALSVTNWLVYFICVSTEIPCWSQQSVCCVILSDSFLEIPHLAVSSAPLQPQSRGHLLQCSAVGKHNWTHLGLTWIFTGPVY